ncbi:hypothetical protein [Cerasicoccus fimbriatus]|uniref:hypothetical protein n=1 Tax=Cerasicoccus fimbriatus TaxID=3014554 RepID=UPI0022B4AD5D|nr:hypothetical protein [Cerasicoccus sp. TK19100]
MPKTDTVIAFERHVSALRPNPVGRGGGTRVEGSGGGPLLLGSGGGVGIFTELFLC